MIRTLAILLVETVLLASTCLGSETLVLSVLITRHGDRAPFARIKNADYQWGTVPADLTPIGMNQEYTLGTRLRKRYVEEMRLLQREYVPNSILCYASSTNRTIQSALCLLTGLYPPGTGPVLSAAKPALPAKMQVIPIRTVPETSFLILTPHERHHKILEKYVYHTAPWKKKEEEYRPRFENWGKTLGYEIKTLKSAVSVGDVLLCAKSHDFPLPKGMSPEDADAIRGLTSWGLAHQFKVDEVCYLMGGELLNKIAGDFADHIEGKTPHKLVLYSGHDITIMPLLGLLGRPLNEIPGYASCLALELCKNDSGAYSIKILFNGEDVILPSANGAPLLPYEAFVKLVERVNGRFKNLKFE